MDAELLVDLRSEIGEGPLWDHRSGRLLFIDVVAGELFSATLDGRVEILGMGHSLGAVGLRAEGGYVLATQHGVATLEPGGKPEPFSDLRLAEGMRMNDAQVGPDGSLWAGSMSWDARPGAGTLYRIAPDGSWRAVLESLTVSNGIGWNAAGDTMFYVDSATHTLEAFDRDPAGAISGRRVLAEVPEGLPDGLCVDDDDHVWLAVYGSGTVVRFAPTGERVATVRVPASQATSCCFAGDDLDVLVITSAGEGLTPVERHDQHAGAIFAADVGVRGRRANAFGRLRVRRALVTGSARGIGRAVAEALAADGLEVVGVDVEPGETIRADLGDPEECARVAAEAGDVDVLVNNAAVLFRTPLEEFGVDEFDRTVAVNLRAVFLLSQALAPRMAGRGWGRIVNVSSIGARDGRLSHGAIYAASKAGVLALTRSFARKYGDAGVTVNTVAPGAVETEMTASIPSWTRSGYLVDIPAGRFCNPAEVAAAVTFLAGDGAAFVNGATLDVNGGWFAP